VRGPQRLTWVVRKRNVNAMKEANFTTDQLNALLVQLTELNNRARWYSSQLWQVPFAYLGVTGVLLSQMGGASPENWLLMVAVIAIFRVFIGVHMNGIADGEKRAVLNLQATEEALMIPPTALYKPNYARPFYVLVIVVVGLSTIAAFVLAWQVYA